MIIIFPLQAFSFVRAFPPSSSSSSSSPSLITLMKALEETKARIIREQLARTQRRTNELRIQERRRIRKVKRTEESSQRTEESIQESKEIQDSGEAFISSHRAEKQCRSVVLLSRFCYLLCVCLVIVLVFIFVCVFVAIRHGNKENQMDFKGREWKDV